MNNKIQKRFNELEEDIKKIYASKYTKQGKSNIYVSIPDEVRVDAELFKEWSLKVRNLFSLCCGIESMYYKEFYRTQKTAAYYSTFTRLKTIFMTAKNEYENGYLTSIRTLITAEVFDNELEQAQELLDNKYHVAAAVIAGTVLETAIRELCDSQSPKIAHGKLDKMNAELKKAGVYNQLQAKRITALADIRNSAAHGKSSEFTHDDVKIMIRDIESFLANHLSD